MQKRKIIIGGYDTAEHGWTLSALELSAPEMKTTYIDKPSGDGAWDLSTTLTDGLPRYKNRTLTATLELSDGTRQEREAKIRSMINELAGFVWDVKLPDDAAHHLTGRVHVARGYNDLAHAAVTVTAVCEPWKYADEATILTLTLRANTNAVILENAGRRAVVPTIEVAEGSSLLLEYRGQSIAMSPGVYQWPVLLLTPGTHSVAYSGEGTATITYREAVLE